MKHNLKCETQFSAISEHSPWCIRNPLCDPVYERSFCTTEWNAFILLHSVQYKYDAISFKTSYPSAEMYLKNFVCLCRRILSPKHSITMLSILYQIWKACINFMTFEKYLRQFERTQTDWQTDRQQTKCIKFFQLCWKHLGGHSNCQTF